MPIQASSTMTCKPNHPHRIHPSERGTSAARSQIPARKCNPRKNKAATWKVRGSPRSASVCDWATMTFPARHISSTMNPLKPPNTRASSSNWSPTRGRCDIELRERVCATPHGQTTITSPSVRSRPPLSCAVSFPQAWHTCEGRTADLPPADPRVARRAAYHPP